MRLFKILARNHNAQALAFGLGLFYEVLWIVLEIQEDSSGWLRAPAVILTLSAAIVVVAQLKERGRLKLASQLAAFLIMSRLPAIKLALNIGLAFGAALSFGPALKLGPFPTAAWFFAGAFAALTMGNGRRLLKDAWPNATSTVFAGLLVCAMTLLWPLLVAASENDFRYTSPTERSKCG